MKNISYELRYLPLFYEELDNNVSYIAFTLQNPDAANNLLDEVEEAILKRLENGPEIFERVSSSRDRLHPYYRIYVKDYIIYYVVLEENSKKIMNSIFLLYLLYCDIMFYHSSRQI